MLASAGGDGTVRLWDPRSEKPRRRPLTGHSGRVNALAFGVDGAGHPVLASAGDDGKVRLWDPDRAPSPRRPETEHTGEGSAVAFGVDKAGQSVLASASGLTVRLWNPDTGQPRGNAKTDWRAVAGVAFGRRRRRWFHVRRDWPGYPLLAIASTSSIKLSDPITGVPRGASSVDGDANLVRAVAFGIDRAERPVLAIAVDDGTVRLWDPDRVRPRGRPLTGHIGRVNAVAFGVDGAGQPVLASAGDDGTVRLWDPGTGEPRGRPLTGHSGRVNAVAFGVDRAGHPVLATAGDDGTMRLWDRDTETCLIQRRTAAIALASRGDCYAIADKEGISVIGELPCPHASGRLEASARNHQWDS